MSDRLVSLTFSVSLHLLVALFLTFQLRKAPLSLMPPELDLATVEVSFLPGEDADPAASTAAPPEAPLSPREAVTGSVEASPPDLFEPMPDPMPEAEMRTIPDPEPSTLPFPESTARLPEFSERPAVAPPPVFEDKIGDEGAESEPAAVGAGSESGAVIAPPSPNQTLRIRYPLSSRRRGEEGTVSLRVTVSPSGEASQVEIEKSSGFPALDREAARAVKRANFTPARSLDRAVESVLLIPIEFKLSSPRTNNEPLPDTSPPTRR